MCSGCGAESPKWMGKCPGCGEWNTLQEIEVSRSSGKKTVSLPKTEKLKIVTEDERISTDVGEFDRVLGGGAIRGEVMLFGGAPGIGKSTLLLNLCEDLLGQGFKVLYFSAEESVSQISQRAMRVVKNHNDIKDKLDLVNSSDVDEAVSFVEGGKYDVVIVDSIQTVSTDDLSALPGSISQVRESAMRLTRAAKSSGTVLAIVGHVTKEGNVAGPMVLSHIVDAVFVLEGDSFGDLRILRGVKNRFGNVNEIGLFQMLDIGMVPVEDASEVLIGKLDAKVPGVARGVLVEGVRPMLIDVQALVTKTAYSMPKRVSNGIELRRLQMLIAVLSKVSRLKLSEYDVFVNIAGGFQVKDPALDLPICMAILSSYKNKPLPISSAYIGEVGLSGEVRPTMRHKSRLGEASRLGVKNIHSCGEGKNGYRHISEFVHSVKSS